MTNNNINARQAAFRAVITQFLQQRRDSKLQKLAVEDERYQALQVQYQWRNWFEDAARRVSQIQRVTHSLKGIHPDARGTSLYCDPAVLPQHEAIGSHCLGNTAIADVTGNAAALDVYKFLELHANEVILLSAMQQQDADLKAALSDDVDEAQRWIDAFLSISATRGDAASHVFAKQVYWLAGDDPLADADYHLLAPLYPASLAHRLYQQITADRFGDDAVAARRARRDKQPAVGVIHDYPDLAVRQLGGSNPQGISLLNSARGGQNYLLSSLPPRWESGQLRKPLKRDTLFDKKMLSTGEMRTVICGFQAFIHSDPPQTMATRDQVDEYLQALCDELINYCQILQTALPPGWTRDKDCRLSNEEKLWLDPGRLLLLPLPPPDTEEEKKEQQFHHDWFWMDWPKLIAGRFAAWVKQRLSEGGKAQNNPLNTLGDAEFDYFSRDLLLNVQWAGRLHNLRQQMDAPTYIPAHAGAVQEVSQWTQ